MVLDHCHRDWDCPGSDVDRPPTEERTVADTDAAGEYCAGLWDGCCGSTRTAGPVGRIDDLTADQKEKVTAAMKEQTDKMMALRNDSSIAQEDRRPKAKEIRDAFTAKLKTILTPEQYTKFEELSKQGMRPPGAPPTAPAAPKAPSTQN